MRASEGGGRGGRFGGCALAAGLGAGLWMSVVFGGAFPGFGAWWLALVGLAPVMAVACVSGRVLVAGVGVGCGSALMWGVHHWWVSGVSVAGFPALVVYLSLWPAVFVWAVGAGRLVMGERLWVAWAVAPVVWVGLEWWRGEVAFDGYAWFFVGHPLIEFGGVRGLAGVLGQYGVGLLAASVNGAAGYAGWEAWRWWRGRAERGGADLGAAERGGARWGLTACCGVVFAALGLGAAGMWVEEAALGEGGGGELRVGVVQTAVPQSNKEAWELDERVRDLRDFWAMTERVSGGGGGGGDGGDGVWGADVVVWPETMFPGLTLEPGSVAAMERSGFGGLASFSGELLSAQGRLGVPMLVGALGVDGWRVEGDAVGWDGRFNSVYLLRGGVVEGARYDKVHLTPFGEVMPYVSGWPWLERLVLGFGASGMSFDLDAGGSGRVFVLEGVGGEGVGVVTPVCFELTVFGVCRDLVFAGGERRAGVMVQVTNDGWFGGWRGGKEHHLLHARWRAAELRTPVVRAANTGVSAWVGRTGRMMERGVDEVYGGWRSERAGDWGGADRVGDGVSGVLRARVRGGVGVPGAVFVGGWIGALCGALAGVVLVSGAFAGLRGRGGRAVGGGGSKAGLGGEGVGAEVS